MSAALRPKMTVDQFLDWVETQEGRRYELIAGEVFEPDAMTGGRRVHARIATNIASRLHVALSGTPCQVFGDNLAVAAGEGVLYPDVLVTCSAADRAAERSVSEPTLIVEVLSPSTQGHDRGPRFARYRTLAAFREYVLVDPDSRRVEVFRRGADGLWVLHDFTGTPALEIACLGCTLPMAQVFEGVDAAPASEDGGQAPV